MTGADFNYHGSITLDPKHCEMAGIYPMEFIDVWNKNWAGATIRSPRSAKLILIFDESHYRKKSSPRFSRRLRADLRQLTYILSRGVHGIQ